MMLLMTSELIPRENEIVSRYRRNFAFIEPSPRTLPVNIPFFFFLFLCNFHGRRLEVFSGSVEIETKNINHFGNSLSVEN